MHRHGSMFQALVGLLTLVAGLAARSAAAQLVLPRPDPPFTGVAAHTLAGSKPEYVHPPQAPAGAPNILVVLIDDAGFGNPSTFGGPVHTPTLDRIAQSGLRYNAFHVVALCSPTRAALLSGRNHHAMHFGSIAEAHNGWPGYDSMWPKAAASLPEILRQNGYSTAAFGKWHLTPDEQQGPSGPFDRWPNALGFDYFWGFLGGETGQYDPLLVENNTVVGVPTTKDYYFPDDMTARTVGWIRAQKSQTPDRPFFVYFATGATHAPHHVPRDWSDRYKGKFDQGWDKLREETYARQQQLGVIPAGAKLTPRPPELPAWDSVPQDQRALFARQMEVYAGFQENTDYQVGRVVEAIDSMGLTDNTLIVYIFGDNGASMEGTLTGSFNEMTVLNGFPLTAEQQLQAIEAYGGLEVWGEARTFPHYSAAWAWAGNAPFQWGKQVASHLGGIRSPMVISWPKRIADKGGLRSQFTHVTDLTPTILEVTGITAPINVDGIPQMPMHGTSLAFTFADAAAPSRHTQQYFEMLGNRGMYKDGWFLSCRLPRVPWKIDPEAREKLAPGVWDPDKDPCELYNLNTDFSQADNLAAQEPARVEEMRALFWAEAARYDVLPLLGGIAMFWGIRPPPSDRTVFTFYPGMQNVMPGMIPDIYNRSFAISADIDVPQTRCLAGWCIGGDGVLVANASFLGGFSLYVQAGRPRFTYSLLGVKLESLESPDPLPPGKVNVRFYAGMDIGRDNGLPVSPGYYYYLRAPFPFDGTIEKVQFELR